MTDQRRQPNTESKLIAYLNEHGPQCAVCRYWLKGLADAGLCPECGSEIDRDRLAPAHVRSAISAATTWCALGALGWIITAYVWWLAHTIRFPASRYEEPLDLSEHLDDLASTGAIFGLAVCLIVWRFRAINIIYADAIKSDMPRLRTPWRIIIVASPGVILGTFGGGLLLMLITVA